MAPLVREFKSRNYYDVKICLTGQHREMIAQVNSFFNIKGDYDLDLMQKNQSLFSLTAKCLQGLEKVLENFLPDIVFVQGDTTSVMAGSIAAFYKNIPVAHLEAGLRSYNIYSPFPEEMNRKVTSQVAKYHFAPTSKAAQNLFSENIKENVFIVGNTVIDALLLGLQIIDKNGDNSYLKQLSKVDFSKKIILVTGHRRESFGNGFYNICKALKTIALQNKNIEIVYPVHLNPNVNEVVNENLSGVKNIHLFSPFDYPTMIWLMNKSYLVLTDSGGIQEEAPALGKPVLVMRDVTERLEGIEAGTAKLIGTNPESIISEVEELLHNPSEYDKMAKAINPYGDGTASCKIVDIFDTINKFN